MLITFQKFGSLPPTIKNVYTYVCDEQYYQKRKNIPVPTSEQQRVGTRASNVDTTNGRPETVWKIRGRQADVGSAVTRLGRTVRANAADWIASVLFRFRTGGKLRLPGNTPYPATYTYGDRIRAFETAIRVWLMKSNTHTYTHSSV